VGGPSDDGFDEIQQTLPRPIVCAAETLAVAVDGVEQGFADLEAERATGTTARQWQDDLVSHLPGQADVGKGDRGSRCS
jgi:hypothetical protein